MITDTWIVSGKWKSKSPLHIGGADAGSITDMQHVRNGQGELILPGTAVAGSLRSAYSDNIADQDKLFGHQEGASPLFIGDAPLLNEAPTLVRTSTSIDRITGAAAQGRLYSRELLVTGATFELSWMLRGNLDTDPDLLERLHDLVRLAKSNGIYVGAGRSVGLGRIIATDVKVAHHRTSTAADVWDLLSGSVESSAPHLGGANLPQRASVLRVTIPWRPLGPVVSKVEVLGSPVDSVPLGEASADNETRLVIPGSSIKGALRSRCEYIARTAAKWDADSWAHSASNLDAQLHYEASPAVGDLFGRPPVKRDGQKHPGKRAALTAREVTTRTAISTRLWDKVVNAAVAGTADEQRRQATSLLANAVDELNNGVGNTGIWFDVVHRTTIDRWSGGVIDGALYGAVEPHATTTQAWDPLILEIELARLQAPDASLGLLLNLLNDLCRGQVALGAGTGRGSGSIEVFPEEVKFELQGAGDAPENWRTLAKKHRTLSDVIADRELVGCIAQQWVESLTPQPGYPAANLQTPLTVEEQ